METSTAIPAPLPWLWFDFAQTPQSISADTAKSVDEGGGERVWKISEAGREIPFKYLRRAAQTGTHRLTLVLLHGMGLNIATFRGIASYLLPTHDLVLPDYSLLSSSGKAGWPRGGVPIHLLADVVWSLADALRIERLSLGGNSLGGGMCLLATLARPERVDRIVLTNPACYPQELPKMYRYARIPLLGEFLLAITRPERLIGGVEYIGYVQKDRFDAELRSRYLLNMGTRKNRHRLMDLIRHLPGHAGDMRTMVHLPRLRAIAQPVLIVWGDKDPLLVAGSGRRLAEDLPHATYREFPALAHMPHEEAPEIVGPLWADFLNGGGA